MPEPFSMGPGHRNSQTENHVLFSHGVDQKRQGSGVGARTIDQEVLEKNF